VEEMTDNRDVIRAQLSVLREEVTKEDSDSPLRKKLLEQIDELRKDFQDVCREMDKPDDIRLAELIHSKMCTWNHTDGCGWHYEKWEDAITQPHSARKRYLDKARAVLQSFSVEDAIKFMEILKK
jgi:hypothetical protein